MIYLVAVYYHGPKTEWSGKLDESEVVFVSQANWLWLARALAKNRLGNTGRCGYVITKDDEVVEHYSATAPIYGAA